VTKDPKIVSASTTDRFTGRAAMQTTREWLLTTVVDELSTKGMKGLHVKPMAIAGGMDVEKIAELFPDKRSLIAGLIEEVFAAQQEYLDQDFDEGAPPYERLIRFIERSLDFVNHYPLLADVIILALLGSDADAKDQVHDQYARLLAPVSRDLLREKIIPDESPLVIADLSEVLLAVIFLGGCPGLQMDYLSFIDARKVAVSTLSAIKRRYLLKREIRAESS
jgi:AcrR family transcriptional regulator